MFNVLLQILDDGRVTDSHGRTVDFKNTVIIMTSNLGSQDLLDSVTEHGTVTEDARRRVTSQLRSAFRPEFLNRIDDTVIFEPLQLAEIEQIVELLVEDLRRRLDDRSLGLELTDAARSLIAREGFDPVFGARPLKRHLQREVETPIARLLVAGQPVEGSVVRIDGVDGELSVTAQDSG